jgi:iron complex outermembrane receptor protein
VFERRESDGIDYVRYSPTDLWRATNIDNLHFTGVEASVTWKPAAAQQVDLRYTGLHGAQDTASGVISQYAFNFPSNQAIAAWRVSLPWGVLARTRVGALQRLGQEAYALWDVYIAESRGRVHPFLQLTNLTNTTYQEVQGVVMPKRSVIGGIEISLIR